MLKIEKLTENTFLHVSYLQTEDFGKVACNGMIVRSDIEVLIFDTPADKAASKELIDYIENIMKCKIMGVVATHFHVDCLGGLAEFHQAKIPSYATIMTIDLANGNSGLLPENILSEKQKID